MAPRPLKITLTSTLPTALGRTILVNTDESQPVEVLIIEFCMQTGVPQKDDFVIRRSNGKILESDRRFSTYGITDDQELFIGIRGETEQWFCGCTQWWLLATVTFLIGAVGITAVTVLKFQISTQPQDFSLVLDAGSSHTQLYVYFWDANKLNNTGKVQQSHSCRAKGGGISSYTEHPEQAGASLEPCLLEADAFIPTNGDSPVFLGATAGMRLLDAANTTTSGAILSSVKQTLNRSEYKFQSSYAQIISGKSEGAYAWVTTNYLTDAFFSRSSLSSYLSWIYTTPVLPTFGAMDLGGASTQIAFVPQDVSSIPAEDKVSFTLYGGQYSIYSHSYLCYGQNEARRLYQAQLVKNSSYATTVDDPCRPAGNWTTLPYGEVFEAPCTQHLGNSTVKARNFTFNGTSNSDECRAAVHSIFNFNCDNCTFNGTFMPAVYGNYYAFSGFFTTLSFLNTTNSSLAEFEAATADWCKKNWSQASTYPAPRQYLPNYCFAAHYIHILLTDAYKFSNETWSTISFSQKVDGTTLGWSLGFMLNATNSFPVEGAQAHLSTAVFIVLLVLFVFFFLLSVCFCCYARKASQRDQDVYRRLENYGTIDG